jgi:radical SAM superfamily enzyme YgiQ (UPF0313 family)
LPRTGAAFYRRGIAPSSSIEKNNPEYSQAIDRAELFARKDLIGFVAADPRLLAWRESTMRILFINPSLRRGHPTKYLPVGIGSVMTFLRHHGYDFDLLDVDIDDLDDAAVESRLAGREYDVVLTGCIVTHYKWIKWLTRTVRRIHPAAKIIVGNSVAGSIPELFLRNTAADVVVIGEGELSTLDTVRAIERGESLAGVEGIAFLDGDTFHQTPKRKACKIDELPTIDWDLFNYAKYFEKSDHASSEGLVFDLGRPPRVMPVATARGCVFKCTFCHYVFWDDPYRHRSPESILSEVRRNIDRYGATYINFWDDLSFSHLKQAEAIADAILASGLKFNWNAAVRSDLFGSPKYPVERRLEVAHKFKEAGCLNLGFSLESANQEILDMMNKRIKAEYFLDQVAVLREVGITCSASVVFGYPMETRETIQQTFDMCLEGGIYPSIGFLLPLPYTGMYSWAREHGYIPDEDRYLESITERQDICLNVTQLSDAEIMDCIKRGASELNTQLQLGLSEDRFVRTGGYRNHIKETSTASRPPLDPEAIKRNENDVSFNYSQVVFDIDLGTGTEAAGKKRSAGFKSRPTSNSTGT